MFFFRKYRKYFILSMNIRTSKQRNVTKMICTLIGGMEQKWTKSCIFFVVFPRINRVTFCQNVTTYERCLKVQFNFTVYKYRQYLMFTISLFHVFCFLQSVFNVFNLWGNIFTSKTGMLVSTLRSHPNYLKCRDLMMAWRLV